MQVPNISYLKNKNEELRVKLGIKGKLKVIRIYTGSVLGLYDYIMVDYIDYQTKQRDSANINDIISWIKWEEKFVDNFIYLELELNKM